MDVLLLNVPFASPYSPNISIPTLVAGLRAEGVSVGAFDLNREFYQRLLTPSSILEGLQYVERRFLELNSASTLRLLDMLEYARLGTLREAAHRHGRELDLLRSGLADFGEIQGFGQPVNDCLVQVAASRYYPELILNMPELVYDSPIRTSSSGDILSSTASRWMFTETLEATLPKLLERYQPRIVGISAVFSTQLVPAIHCARMIKALAPEVHVTLGGCSVSIYFRDLHETRFFQLVDSLVLDEGEGPLLALHRELTSGRACELGRVPGLEYLSGGTIVTVPGKPPLELSALPAPVYEAFSLDSYLNPRGTLRVPLRLSRGCNWGRCAFCRTDLPMVSFHQQCSVDHVYDQLRELIARTGIRSFQISDESADPKVLESLSRRLLADGEKIVWVGHTRVSRALTAERAELFRASGCQRLFVGVESFSDRILRLMGKGITSDLIDEVIRTVGAHVPLGLYMILGFPTETREEALEGCNRIRSYHDRGLIDGIWYMPFLIVYGCEVWRNPERYGISDLRVSRGSDLNPDIYDFDCVSGMTRDEVWRLYCEFNAYALLNPARFRLGLPEESGPMSPRYDLSRIRKLLLEVMARTPFNTVGESISSWDPDSARLAPDFP